ncbi:MAG TPA: hypothetical protein VHR15_08060 [Ktedonobacterales bacterium]|jgi:hypothetical protein|nr:hypothetical protein [Ktedonobacterales bacterium]
MGDGDEAPYYNEAILAHPTEARLLLLTSGDGWALPGFDATEPPAIIQAMRERLGVETIVLRCVYDRARVEPEAREQVYALDVRSADWMPPADARWVDRAELHALTLANPERRPILDAWLDEAEGRTVPPQHAPWERPGWFSVAEAWLRECVGEAGYMLTGPVEQAHARLWSCMLTAPTDRGPLYFKAVEPSFAFEAPLTGTLARRWPAHLPPVVALDAARGWLLTAHGGQVVRDLVRGEDGIVHWERLLAQFAQMQIESAGAADRLIALGVPDRRLARIPQLYQEIVADRETLNVGRPDGLSEEDWKRAQAFLSEVEALCAELAECGLLDGLHHDDFGPGNALLGPDGNYIFFDWSDCAITMPLCSLFIPLRWARYVLDYDDAALARMRCAYLEPWRAIVASEQLERALPFALRLAKLQRALTWRTWVRATGSDRAWEYADSAPYFLRMFLNDDEGED